MLKRKTIFLLLNKFNHFYFLSKISLIINDPGSFY